MSNSEISIELHVNGQPYVFHVDATDGSSTQLVNVASNLSIGNTFSTGATITHARGGYVENYALSGILLLNEQGNVAYQFPVTRLETQNAGPIYPVGVNVGLNYQLVATTSASLV
tara:strand:+ start:103 stop:447 length:345 start_codon:yes stop_codon:yes gene_type:complete